MDCLYVGVMSEAVAGAGPASEFQNDAGCAGDHDLGVVAAGAGLPSSARSFVPRRRNRQAASRWKAIPRLTPSSERGRCSCVQRHSSRPLTDPRRQTQTSRVGGMVKPALPARPRVVPAAGRTVEAQRATGRTRKGMTLVFMAHLLRSGRDGKASRQIGYALPRLDRRHMPETIVVDGANVRTVPGAVSGQRLE